MIAEELIDETIPSLKPEGDISRAKQWMDEFKVGELPVVNNSRLMGFIREESLYDLETRHPRVGKYPLVAQSCVVAPWQHYYDVLKVWADHNAHFVAVVDNDVFKGVIPETNILKELSKTAMVNAPGAILILETRARNYSLAEISKVIEMNGASIVGATVDAGTPDRVKIVLRLSHREIDQITYGLEQTGCIITSTFNTLERSFDEKERFDLLMKHLQF